MTPTLLKHSKITNLVSKPLIRGKEKKLKKEVKIRVIRSNLWKLVVKKINSLQKNCTSITIIPLQKEYLKKIEEIY